jgi:hypothetical protein
MIGMHVIDHHVSSHAYRHDTLHQANFKLVEHHGSIVCTIGSFGDEYGIQHGGIVAI